MENRKSKFIVALSCLAALSMSLAGCSYFTLKVGKPVVESAGKFKAGTSTVTEVMDIHGPPLVISNLPNGYTYLYEYQKDREIQIGVSVQKYFKLGGSIASGKYEELLLIFDDEGVLREIESSQFRKTLNKSIYFQLLITVKSSSGIDRYDTTSPAHIWGMNLLRPLPENLNSGQDLDSGQNGIQQNGTPKDIGQHSVPNAYSNVDGKKWK